MDESAHLDKIDLKILKILQEDAKIPATEIAEKVGLSQSPCWRRIKALQESGCIQSTVAILNRQKLNLGIVALVNIKLSHYGRSSLEAFEKEILAFSEVVECWTISGNMDYILRVVTKDMESYESFLRDHLLRLKHIDDAQSHIAVSEVKNSTQLPI